MIDSHCHLYFDSLKDNFEKIIDESIKNNITSILSINTDPNEFELHYQLINKYKSIYISYGLHPDNVNQKNIPSLESLKFFCNYDKVIGIGETGLDFYHSIDNKKFQKLSFENHIECSYENNLPLIIHQRNSEKEIIDILNYYNKKKPLKVVFHCFTGSALLKNFCLDNDFTISLSGIVTFKNANELRGVISSVPLSNIIIETDSPFLSPSPHRGKQNQPSYVKYTAEYLSNFFNVKFQEFIDITDNNFYKLFSKAIRYNKISQ